MESAPYSAIPLIIVSLCTVSSTEWYIRIIFFKLSNIDKVHQLDAVAECDAYETSIYLWMLQDVALNYSTIPSIIVPPMYGIEYRMVEQTLIVQALYPSSI
jgi:hypothetical protein